MALRFASQLYAGWEKGYFLLDAWWGRPVDLYDGYQRDSRRPVKFEQQIFPAGFIYFGLEAKRWLTGSFPVRKYRWIFSAFAPMRESHANRRF